MLGPGAVLTDEACRGIAAPWVGSSPCRILLVDDDPGLLQVTTMILEQMGYWITPTSSGESALDLMKEREFHLVITDLFMRGIGGLEVLRAAKLLRPAPAVMIMTGDPDASYAVQAFQLEADDFLLKPFSSRELGRRAARCLQKRGCVPGQTR
jgi:DNA-binding NtrC family response regulator